MTKFNSLAEKEAALNRLDVARSKLSKKLDKLGKEASQLRDSIFELKIKQKLKGKKITPELFVSVDWSQISQKWYKTLHDWFCENYSNRGLYPGRVWAETQQMGVQIKLDQNLPLEDQKGVYEFLPHIKPTSKGAKLLDIFDHTCSEFESLVLEVFENKTVLVANRSRTEIAFKNLDEALAYVYLRHPYELKRAASDV